MKQSSLNLTLYLAVLIFFCLGIASLSNAFLTIGAQTSDLFLDERFGIFNRISLNDVIPFFAILFVLIGCGFFMHLPIPLYEVAFLFLNVFSGVRLR